MTNNIITVIPKKVSKEALLSSRNILPATVSVTKWKGTMRRSLTTEVPIKTQKNTLILYNELQ